MFPEKLIVPTLSEIGDKVIYEHENVSFETSCSGTPEPIVEWFRGFSKVKEASKIQVNEIENLHKLLLTNCLTEQSGTITVTASNKAGTCTVEASLTVKGKVTVRQLVFTFSS